MLVIIDNIYLAVTLNKLTGDDSCSAVRHKEKFESRFSNISHPGRLLWLISDKHYDWAWIQCKRFVGYLTHFVPVFWLPCFFVLFCFFTSWIWSCSRAAPRRRTSAAAWRMECSSTPPSSSLTAATWPWTPTSLSPSTLPPSSFRPSRRTWSSTSCCTRPAATWGTCAWWTPTGCWKRRRNTLAANCDPPRASRQRVGAALTLTVKSHSDVQGKRTLFAEHSLDEETRLYNQDWVFSVFHISGCYYLPMDMHTACTTAG